MSSSCILTYLYVTVSDVVAMELFEHTNHIVYTSQPSIMHADDNLTDDTPVHNYT